MTAPSLSPGTEPGLEIDRSLSLTRAVLMGTVAVLMMIPVTMPVTVLRGMVTDRFGVSELSTSMFMSINMVGAVLFAPIAGAFADRYGRRWTWITGALAFDGLCLVLLSLPFAFPVFMGIRFVQGGAHILALSLLLALASEAGSTGKRGRRMGLVGGGITFGVAIGAPLGGIIGRSNPLLPLQVGAAILLLTALFAAWVLPRHSAKRGHAGLPEIFRTVMGNKALLVPLSFAFADRFAVGFYVTTFPLYASRILGLDSAQIGMSLSLFLIPFALLSFPFGLVSERLSRVGMVCAGSLVFGLLTASLGWWPAGGLSALMLMVGVSAAVMYVPSLLLTAELSGESTKATALGGFNAAGSLGFIMGPLTGGWISQTVARDGDWLAGYRTAFGFAGAAEILCVALALLALSALWERSGRP